MGIRAQARAGWFPFWNHPGFAHFIREATPPNLGGELRILSIVYNRGAMKLAILGTRGIPANYGGFETFAEELSTRLAARGHDVTVYGRSNNVRYSGRTYKGVKLSVLPTIGTKYLDTVAHTFLSVF